MHTYFGALDNESRFNLAVAKHDWLIVPENDKLYEVRYRVPAVVAVLHLSPTKRGSNDETDPRHAKRSPASGKCDARRQFYGSSRAVRILVPTAGRADPQKRFRTSHSLLSVMTRICPHGLIGTA